MTIVFSDLKGSTALGEQLDSEALHEVKERYFIAMAAEINRHGGKVEKYIGDAIMAVFGLPQTHEDDALRAVRAALAMQAALDRVNADLTVRFGIALVNRTGINTGEVVANDYPAADQRLATGDAVNVAARLEQAAPENGIYIGELTYRLVRHAVEVDRVEPLELKGKAQRVAAYRLLACGSDERSRRIGATIVGRDAELTTLARIYAEVQDARVARLVAVIGDAGAGKSRLAHEVAVAIASNARVLRGRCLAYGDGITYWPLRGMVGAAAEISDEDTSERAREKLLGVVGEAEVADRLLSAIGLSAATFPLHEVNWAARKFLERLALDGPVVVLVDDIHWAEPAFLMLLEHILDAASGAAILMLTTARHELLEQHPQWGERGGATRLVLQPLDRDAVSAVIASFPGSAGLPADVAERIAGTANGNPLFVEQMLSMLLESGDLRQEGERWVRSKGDAEIVIPPTIRALLEARLDRLGRAERHVVEPAAVIGLEFAEDAVASLVPDAVRPAIAEHMIALARKQFVRLSHIIETERTYCFQHQLVRDTVYNSLLKRTRARIHVSFVRWADQVNADRERSLEFEAILGYHLEQAHNYLAELGPLDEEGRMIGVDGARRLASAGRRAFARGDAAAAGNLLRRSVALLQPEDSMRLAMLPELGEVLLDLGQFAEARSLVSEALERAQASGNRTIEASARLARMLVRLHSEPGNWSDGVAELTMSVIPLLEQEAAHGELAKAWRLVALAQQNAGHMDQASETIENVIRHARLAGDDRLVARSALGMAMSAVYGPTPAMQAIAQCEALIAGDFPDRQVKNLITCLVSQLHAMVGNHEVARRNARSARAVLRDLGQGVRAAASSIDLATVELLAGDPAAAERELRTDFEMLLGLGETYFSSSMATLLARAVHEQGRDEEALVLTGIAESSAGNDDLDVQASWRSARALILARRGAIAEAELLARAALDLAKQTEAPTLLGSALADLATVLFHAQRNEDARKAIGEAIAVYGAKGDTSSAARAQKFLNLI
ncbi:MAG TPA: adenylate/guanylate cyclase domain-containing protein [Burkholderiaceae bacterium]|nr:adenylate/guanylate cyclase domain-containing protein [Burkholderiaceae bacterium]